MSLLPELMPLAYVIEACLVYLHLRQTSWTSRTNSCPDHVSNSSIDIVNLVDENMINWRKKNRRRNDKSIHFLPTRVLSSETARISSREEEKKENKKKKNFPTPFVSCESHWSLVDLTSIDLSNVSACVERIWLAINELLKRQSS